MWKTIKGREVYMDDNGNIVRGVKRTLFDLVPAYVYRKDRNGGWNFVDKISESAFRAGINRGTIELI